jgi:hypothetical protein
MTNYDLWLLRGPGGPEDDDVIQGYVGTITNRGKVRYAKFGGGQTARFDAAEVCASASEAIDLARLRARTIWDVPGAIGIDDEGRPLSI